MPSKKYISLTELARSVGVPKRIILRLIDDGVLTPDKIEEGEVWFDRKHQLDDWRFGYKRTTYYQHFLETGELPAISKRWEKFL